jgi:uncharacterized Ntn-hydrolase superfamily protein
MDYAMLLTPKTIKTSAQRRALTILDLGTFSMVARDSDPKAFGVAVATARPNVGSLVPFVSLEGAIATQARVNTDIGRKGLELLRLGYSISDALEFLLSRDEERERRQVHGLDARGAFAFTGQQCVSWCGHLQGLEFSVAGNMLVGAPVLEAMAEAFEATRTMHLSERLLSALEAGQAIGGDKRGKQSAALLVASPDPRLYHNLRVDDHPEPVAELRRIYDRVVLHCEQIKAEYGEKGLRLFGKVKY